MKTTNSGNEMADLQRSIQENTARVNDIYKYIGKLYYEQAKDSPSADFEPHFKAVKDTLDKIKQMEARIKFINGIVVCTKCEMENGVKSSFCAGCGTRLPHTFAADGANRCGRCGNVLNPGQKFCGVCGAPSDEKAPEAPVSPAVPVVEEKAPVVVETPAPAPVVEEVPVAAAAAPVEVEKRFCPNCGMEATESDSLFCSGCGCKLD